MSKIYTGSPHHSQLGLTGYSDEEMSEMKQKGERVRKLSTILLRNL